jgi:CHRD domain-containing protein
MKQLWIVALAALVAVLGAPTIVADEGEGVEAELSGFEEVPAVSSTGQGEFKAEIGAAAIEFELSYEALEGTTTLAAHIHLGQKDVNGGIIAFLCGEEGGKPACTPTAGKFSGTITAADVLGPDAQGIAPGEFDEVVRAIRAGKVYANVHTDKHPGGEIRGQIDDDDDDDDQDCDKLTLSEVIEQYLSCVAHAPEHH